MMDCDFCNGKRIEPDKWDDGQKPMGQMLGSMFGFGTRYSGIIFDPEDNTLGFDNSDGEYTMQYVVINYCPFCGRKFEER